MPEYAISAVGQASTDERLIGSGPGNEVLRFEEICSRQNSYWDLTKNSWNQIKIIQNPSPTEKLLKNEKTAWDIISTRTLDRLDDIQRQWNNVRKTSSSLDTSSKVDMTGVNGPKAKQTEFKSILKVFNRMMDNQVRLTFVTSIATIAKNSIATLYRQQG